MGSSLRKMTKLGCLLCIQNWMKQFRQTRLPLIVKAMKPGSGELRVAIDCSLDCHRPKPMSDKEVVFLAKQVAIAHSLNYKASRPCHLHLTGLVPNGRIECAFRKHIGNYDRMLVTKTDKPHHTYFDPKDVVYLSPDSNHELQAVTPDTVYVIGGLVDRTVDKYASEVCASRLGLKTAKLPIHSYIKVTGGQHLCLPLNIVVGILLSVHFNGDWTEAFTAFIPQRKRSSIVTSHCTNL